MSARNDASTFTSHVFCAGYWRWQDLADIEDVTTVTKYDIVYELSTGIKIKGQGHTHFERRIWNDKKKQRKYMQILLLPKYEAPCPLSNDIFIFDFGQFEC